MHDFSKPGKCSPVGLEDIVPLRSIYQPHAIQQPTYGIATEADTCTWHVRNDVTNRT